MRFLYPWAFIGLLGVGGLAWFLRAQWSQRAGLDRAAFVVRALALVLLIGSLAGPQAISRQPMRYVYFLADRSASASAFLSDDALLQAMKAYVQPDERVRYGLIVFGREAYVDQPLSEGLPRAIHTEVDPAGTDLAGALRLVLETMPPARSAQGPGTAEAVVFSDGQVDPEGLAGALARARAAGVRVWSYPVGRQEAIDVRVDALELPREVAPGAGFSGAVRAHASQPLAATLLIYRDDELLGARPVELDAGSNVLRFSDTLSEAGHHRYQVYLRADGDVLIDNNVASDLVTVTGGASVLVVEREPGNSEGLVRLLNASGYETDRTSLSRALSLGKLAAYKAVVLDNVPLSALGEPSVNALKAYAGQLGGGLWVVEGQTALAGVADHPLEDLLPVTFEGPQQEQLPGVAIVFVLDRSSSMGQSVAPGVSQSKLDVLKEAAAASVEILRPDDWVGIVMFDSTHGWLVEPAPLDDKRAVYDQIRQIFAGGGTDLFPPLRDALDRLEEINSRVKHVLVFSDGKTVRQGRDFDALFERLRASQITVSSIGFGQQPDEEMLTQLAEAGRGELFLVQDARELPQISVRETRRVSRRRWVTGAFETAPGPHALARLSGLDTEALPGLDGYVRTYAKPLAQTALQVADDPLLSFWQYGLGQVAVLNTDLEGLWSGRWLDWPGLSELAGEVVAQLFANPTADAGLVLRHASEDGALALDLEAQDGRRWVNLLDVSAQLLNEQGIADAAAAAGTDVSFDQVAPGRYAARVPGAGQGLYLLRLEARSEGELAAQQTHVITVPYPQEYEALGANEAVLTSIAERTGGAVLEDERLDFGPLASAGPVYYRDLWPWGLGLALTLLLADLALRKLPLEALLMRLFRAN